MSCSTMSAILKVAVGCLMSFRSSAGERSVPSGFGGPNASVVVFLVSRLGVVVVVVVELEEEEGSPGGSGCSSSGGAGEAELDEEDLDGTGGFSVPSSFLYSSSLSTFALPGVLAL